MEMNLKVLMIALRLNTLPAIIGPILVGYFLAWRLAPASLEHIYVIPILIAGLAIQISTNLFNDYIDGVRGADHKNRLGPDRVTAKELMSANATKNWALFFCFIAFLAGVPIVVKGGLLFIALGILSLVLTYLYTGTRFSLAYTGMADLFVILFFGLFAVWGTFYILTLDTSTTPFILGAQVGMMCTNILVINNLRDIHQDKENHKKTLIVRFGRLFGLLEYLVASVLSYVFILLWPDELPKGGAMVLALPWLLFSLLMWDWVRRNPPSKRYNKILKLTGLCHLGFCVAISLAIYIF